MSRFFPVALLSLCFVAPAVAQVPEVSRAPANAAAAPVVIHVAAESGGAHADAAPAGGTLQSVLPSVAVSIASGESADATAAASGDVLAQMHRIRDMLTRNFGLARAKAEQISSAVMASASKYSLPPALVLAIISIESRFQDHARGAHGATGLMQVVPSAHKRLVKNLDLTEPAANIEAGSAILRGYLESARGDVSAALKSYGGSAAYARKVSMRAKDFQTADAASDADAEVATAR